MITRLYIFGLRQLAAHHDRRTRALGAAVLAAQERRDWDGIGAIWRKREHHRQRRDVLTLKASALDARDQAAWLHADGETCPPCNSNCRQGRRCPARSAR